MLNGNIDEYNNHVGTLDNLCSTTESGSCTVSENSTDNSITFDTGTSAVGTATLLINHELDISAYDRIIASFVVGDFVGGTTSAQRYVGFGFINSSLDQFIMIEYGNSFNYWVFSYDNGDGSGYSNFDMTLAKGDIVSLVLKSDSIRVYKNGTLVHTDTTHLTMDDIYVGARMYTMNAAPTVASSFDLDSIGFKVIK
jgi:hypothetical protein